jgi:hypothetical protein
VNGKAALIGAAFSIAAGTAWRHAISTYLWASASFGLAPGLTAVELAASLQVRLARALPLLPKFPYRRVVELWGPRTGSMAKSISEVMDDLRQDVARWKAELICLRAQSVTPQIEKVEKFIADAEVVLSRWESPN